MTVFTGYASSFRFLNNNNITDVNTIISDFRSETVTNGSPAWTEPTSQNFKSPVDGAGRFFTVVLTRTTQFRLEFKILDQNYITVCDREIDINSTATASVNYYTGQYHAWIEIMTGGATTTPEVAMAGILDTSPLALGLHNLYVYGNAYRNSAGTVDGNGSSAGDIFMLDSGVSAAVNRMRDVGQNINGNNVQLVDATGNLMYLPCEMSATVSGATRWIGRPYQAFWCDGNIGTGCLKTVIIGTAGETGTFRVISQSLMTGNIRFMMRSA